MPHGVRRTHRALRARAACSVRRKQRAAHAERGVRPIALLRTACSNCSVREARAACGECGVNPVKCAAHAARGKWRAACGLRRQPCGERRVLRVQRAARAARAARDVRPLLRAVLEHAACGVRCRRVRRAAHAAERAALAACAAQAAAFASKMLRSDAPCGPGRVSCVQSVTCCEQTCKMRLSAGKQRATCCEAVRAYGVRLSARVLEVYF